MDKVEVVNPPELAPPKGYAHGIVTPAGRLLFVAGQVAWDRQERVVSDDFVAQFDQALANFVAVVRAAGGDPASLAQMTVYVTDKREYIARTREVGGVWRKHVGKTFPAMALIEVKALLEEGAKVELQGVVAL
jgi:enamine deaminase RidA (YjgF/YER057c/UK114 family)